MILPIYSAQGEAVYFQIPFSANDITHLQLHCTNKLSANDISFFLFQSYHYQ
jgi:hypothetical protein